MWLHFGTDQGAALTDDDGNEIATLSSWRTERRMNTIPVFIDAGAVRHIAGYSEALVTMEFWVSDMDAFDDFMRQWIAARAEVDEYTPV